MVLDYMAYAWQKVRCAKERGMSTGVHLPRHKQLIIEIKKKEKEKEKGHRS